MPTISNLDTPTVQPLTRRYVQAKQRWSDPWVLLPDLDPVQARQQSAPSVGEADIAYEFGSVKREYATAFAAAPDLTLNDRYVRILLQRPGAQPVPVWYGVGVDTQSTLISSDREGWQEFKAYELSHLLDRVEIRTSWVRPTKPAGENEGESTREVVEINRVVVFNERIDGDTILGNRSEERHDPQQVGTPEDEEVATWYFDYENGQTWTALDVAEYLLKRIAPPEIRWEITGQTEPLTKTIAIWDLEGKTVWQALCELIRRDRGLGFYLRVGQGENDTDTEQTVEVVVYSIAERAYSYGVYELPANDNPVFLALPGDQTAHLVSEIPFRNTATTQYDTIEVVGKRFLAAATFSVLDGTLEKGWTDEQENLYRQGIVAGGDDDAQAAEENDQFRASEGMAAVWCHYKVPTRWDCLCAGAEIGVDFAPAVPEPLENGDYDSESVGEFWNYGRTFEKELPFFTGFSYDTRIDELQQDYQPTLRPLLVGIRYVESETQDDRHVALDRLHDVDELLVNPSAISLLDGAMGVDIQFAPRHYLAKNHWEGAAPSFYEPELDWEDLWVTAAFETDDPPRIVLRRQGGAPSEVEKKLRIDVPGAEYWWVSKQTVVDVDYAGQLVRYLNGEAEPEEQYVRYDRPKLEAVASFASAWYGPRRQPVQIPIKELGLFVPIGSLLTDIRGIFGVEPIRTPVTSRTWDFQRDRTFVETGYVELDFVGLMDDNYLSEEMAAELSKAEVNRRKSRETFARLRNAKGPRQHFNDAYNSRQEQWTDEVAGYWRGKGGV